MKRFDVAYLMFMVAGLFFVLGAYWERSEMDIEIRALKAQVDKIYCEGEIKYPNQVAEEGGGPGRQP